MRKKEPCSRLVAAQNIEFLKDISYIRSSELESMRTEIMKGSQIRHVSVFVFYSEIKMSVSRLLESLNLMYKHHRK